MLFVFRRYPQLIASVDRLPLPQKCTDFVKRFLTALIEQMTAKRLTWMIRIVIACMGSAHRTNGRYPQLGCRYMLTFRRGSQRFCHERAWDVASRREQ